MRLEDLKDHIDARFTKVEQKLDDHLERVSKAEEAIVWIRGHVRISTTIFITIALAAILYALGLRS